MTVVTMPKHSSDCRQLSCCITGEEEQALPAEKGKACDSCSVSLGSEMLALRTLTFPWNKQDKKLGGTRTVTDHRLCQAKRLTAVTAERHTVKHLLQYVKTDFKTSPFLM